MARSKIVVLDFGSQYAHLIAKRMRSMGYYTEIALPSADIKEFENAKGIVFSGGPSSVYDEKVPEFNEKILELDVPILGLCYGHQLIAKSYGAEVGKAETGEFGFARLELLDQGVGVVVAGDLAGAGEGALERLGDLDGLVPGDGAGFEEIPVFVRERDLRQAVHDGVAVVVVDVAVSDLHGGRQVVEGHGADREAVGRERVGGAVPLSGLDLLVADDVADLLVQEVAHRDVVAVVLDLFLERPDALHAGEAQEVGAVAGAELDFGGGEPGEAVCPADGVGVEVPGVVQDDVGVAADGRVFGGGVGASGAFLAGDAHGAVDRDPLRLDVQRGGELDLAETQYYCDLAEAAGYTFTEEELEPVRDRLAENAAFQTANNISAKNYYIAYYGSGVTEALYTEELTRQVKAQVYKTVLARSLPVQAAAETPADGGSYRAVDIRVITLDAVPDRETGEIGQAQLEALGEKLRRLSVRYAAGESFEALQTAFSTRRLGDKSGVLTDATRADLPEAAAKELLDDQTSLSAGQTVTAIDETTGTAYFILLDGFGASGAELEAALTTGLRAVEAEAEAALASDYTVERLKPGILLATG